uniref:Uncharacterized protein n=1 Tax=Timema poppense TaxID=170557 RepID=A0A7R9H641_TIMPO|nr:unnamed protein product [Timema poppensis]
MTDMLKVSQLHIWKCFYHRGFALATPVLMDSIWLKERGQTSIRLRVSYILVCVLGVNSTVTGQRHIQILRAVQHPSHEKADQSIYRKFCQENGKRKRRFWRVDTTQDLGVRLKTERVKKKLPTGVPVVEMSETTLEGDENSTNTNLHLEQDEEHVWPGLALRATDG